MILLILLLSIITYFAIKFISLSKSLPPGPQPLPLLGNLITFGAAIVRLGGVIPLLKEWKQKYGPVMTIWIGPMPTIHICDYEMAHEAMVRKGSLFTDRYTFYMFDIVRDGRGLINSNGMHSLEQRRFALHTLRNFGLGRNLMQDRIMLEWEYRSSLLNAEIESSDGKMLWNPCHFFELTVGNIINRMLFSERFTKEKEVHFFVLKKELDTMLADISTTDSLIQRWNRNFPILKTRYDQWVYSLDRVVAFIRDQLKQRKESIASGEHVLCGEDFVDAFLEEMNKESAADSFNEESLVITLLDLWLAGQETTSSTLDWAFSYFLQNMEVYHQLQKELDELTGRNRTLNLSDKANTPFLNAVVLETLRLSSLVPMNLWRVAAEDIVVGGHLIKKGSVLTAQLSTVLVGEEYFKNPEKFDPNRFLNGNGAEQHVIAFGMGKRSCLGESLARAELYLIIGNMALNYNIEPVADFPAGMKAMNEQGSLRKPFPYKLLVSKRS